MKLIQNWLKHCNYFVIICLNEAAFWLPLAIWLFNMPKNLIKMAMTWLEIWPLIYLPQLTNVVLLVAFCIVWKWYFGLRAEPKCLFSMEMKATYWTHWANDWQKSRWQGRSKFFFEGTPVFENKLSRVVQWGPTRQL